MTVRIVELFGFDADDFSRKALDTRKAKHCPFVGATCRKQFNDGTKSGVCTVRQMSSADPIICCPLRLYADHHRILFDVAELVFSAHGRPVHVHGPDAAHKLLRSATNVIAFGKGMGKEIKLPKVGGKGNYFVDWILARIGDDGRLAEFVAVEVQSIDTTGTYRTEQRELMRGRSARETSAAGINWENVNKRILPQLIFKGHVLRREPLCKGGLFFVCPTPVYARIMDRLGGQLHEYPVQPGTITFCWYDLGTRVSPGHSRKLDFGGKFTTTIDQLANAFAAPTNLPPANSYESAIREALPKLCGFRD